MPARYKVKLQKVGNSAQVVIPKPVIEGLGWAIGDKLTLTYTDSKVVIERARS